MDIILEDAAQRLGYLHVDFKATIDGLSVAELDWSPDEEFNSLCALVTHTCGAQRYWIGEIAGGEPTARIREQEFMANCQSEEALRALLDKTLAHSQTVMARLTIADLSEAVMSRAHGKKYRRGWAILHALEHTATHLGHAQVTRQLVDLPSMGA